MILYSFQILLDRFCPLSLMIDLESNSADKQQKHLVWGIPELLSSLLTISAPCRQVL